MRFTHSRQNIQIMETFYIPTIDHIFLRLSPPNTFSVKQCAVIFQALRCRNFYGLQSLTVSVPLEDILDDQFFWLRKRTSLSFSSWFLRFFPPTFSLYPGALLSRGCAAQGKLQLYDVVPVRAIEMLAEPKNLSGG